ncbi:MAG: hypothetical protein AMJ79_02935 [Phycisphaerae bacterium SM23_30]|nr:MAG: hypothetical protein AMJ79_02935 [Phycisphaerae bacterium SM23_30]
MLRNEGARLTRVVVCTPRTEYFNVTDLKAQGMNEIADPPKTRQQHDRLKSIMKDFGCEVLDAPECPGHPNSVFTRDPALVTPRGFIQLRMGLKARRGEEIWMTQFLKSLDEPCVGEITTPAVAEGGDLILAGAVAFIGVSDRTNPQGAEQLSAFLSDMDYEVRTLKLHPGYLHIGGAMSALGNRRLLCCKDVFPKDFFKGFDTIEVDHQNFRPSVGNVICLAENEVIANAEENMAVIQILEKEGVKVHGIDLSEFRKGGGGPTCLILPLERK